MNPIQKSALTPDLTSFRHDLLVHEKGKGSQSSVKTTNNRQHPLLRKGHTVMADLQIVNCINIDLAISK